MGHIQLANSISSVGPLGCLGCTLEGDCPAGSFESGVSDVPESGMVPSNEATNRWAETAVVALEDPAPASC